VVAERCDHLVALVLAHQSVIDEHARELVADRSGAQAVRRPNESTPPESPQMTRPRRPARGCAQTCSSMTEARAPVHPSKQQMSSRKRRSTSDAIRRVDGLRVELDPVELALRRLERATADSVDVGQRREARRRLVDGVAVRHPAALLMREVAQQLPLSRTVSCERPNSPTSADSTRPPRLSTIACMP